MVPLTVLEYELDESPDTILSRLNWAVEEVEHSWLDYINNWRSTPDTTKDWVGQIDRNNLRFELEESESSFFKHRYNILLKGKIEVRASTTNIIVKVGLDTFAFILLSFIYIAALVIIYEVITDIDFNDYLAVILFITIFPVLDTVFLIRRIKKAEQKLDKLFAQ